LSLPEAAVSLLVRRDAGADPEGPSVLLGRRTRRESDPWSGHIALPGGRPETRDRDLMDTALRECGEEAGIHPGRKDVVGGLPEIVAGRVTGRHVKVSPFLVVVDDFCQTTEGDGEIDEWMPFPLRDLDDPSLRRRFQASDGSWQDGLETPLGLLWGMTLKLLERTWREPLVPGVERLWLDYDGTVYPASHELADEIDRRITAWVAKARGVAWEDADLLRRDLYRKHGNTLRGMMREDDTDPNAYLDFVFDLPDSAFPGPDRRLRAALEGLGLPISVFTNARADYVRRGLGHLGLEGLVDRVHDIASFGWTAKPEAHLYDEMVRREGIVDPGRVLFVEDRAENLAPARVRGIRCVWIDESSGGDWTESEGGLWDRVPWHWKLRELADLPLLLRPHLGWSGTFRK
jgi:putative hydrolase of the HAD superfamily